MGREIENWRRHGLDPEKIYWLYRPASEIAKAASTLRGKPLLDRHTEATADDHPHDRVVGSVGDSVDFDGSTLTGNITIWDGDAIANVENGSSRHLSLGYFYKFVPAVGTYQGQPYQGIMTDLQYNHCALCAEPRVPGSMVGDSKDNNMDDDDQYGPLMQFLETRLDSDDLAAVRDFLTAISDPNDVQAAGDAAYRAAMTRYHLGSAIRQPPLKPMTAADEARRTAMFPHWNRLKHSY
jgi:hypothetical protein